MRRQVTHVSVHQTRKVVAVVYGLMGLTFVPILLAISLLGGQRGNGLVLTVLFPFLYLVFVGVRIWFHRRRVLAL